MVPQIFTVPIGAIMGALANPDDPKKGAAIGAAIGAVGPMAMPAAGAGATPIVASAPTMAGGAMTGSGVLAADTAAATTGALATGAGTAPIVASAPTMQTGVASGSGILPSGAVPSGAIDAGVTTGSSLAPDLGTTKPITLQDKLSTWNQKTGFSEGAKDVGKYGVKAGTAQAMKPQAPPPRAPAAQLQHPVVGAPSNPYAQFRKRREQRRA